VTGKYKNGKVFVDGIKFDSAAEGERYKILKAKEKAGLIKNLQMQVNYPLMINGLKICDYRADFVYEVGGKTVVEDVKGQLHDVFKLKYKLMFACHGITLLITRALYKTMNKVRYIVGFEQNSDGLVLPKVPTIKKGNKK
jgi:hypothetical protein